MRRLGLLLLGSLWFVSAVISADQQVFRAGTSAVRIHVAVLDGNKPVRGLDVSKFTLRDNGVPQRVSDLSIEPAAVDVVLLLDVSRSLDRGNPWEIVNGLGVSGPYNANEFVARDVSTLIAGMRDHLRSADTLQTLCFDDRIRPVLPAGCPQSAQLGSRHTAFFDALLAAVMHPIGFGRRRLVLAVTDGVDTNSAVPFALRSMVFDRTESVVSVIGLRKQWGSTTFVPHVELDSRTPPPTMSILEHWHVFMWMARDAALRTGGSVYEMPRRGDASTYIGRAVDELRTRYVLSYAPSDRTPGWHRVEVSVPGRNYDLRFKSGYWQTE